MYVKLVDPTTSIGVLLLAVYLLYKNHGLWFNLRGSNLHKLVEILIWYLKVFGYLSKSLVSQWYSQLSFLLEELGFESPLPHCCSYGIIKKKK